jgi:hypothetical protein
VGIGGQPARLLQDVYWPTIVQTEQTALCVTILVKMGGAMVFEGRLVYAHLLAESNISAKIDPEQMQYAEVTPLSGSWYLWSQEM